jgi:ABC-type multidrug transport system permease subunit
MRQRLELIASFIARKSRLWYRFKVSFMFNLISMSIAISIWFFFNFVFGQEGAVAVAAQGFGNDYFKYVLVGVIINQYILLTINLYIQTIHDVYWNNQLEVYLTSPGGLGMFFLSAICWTYLFASMNVLIYFAIGVLIFGASLSISLSGVFLMLIILFLLIVGLSGIGLLSASMFFLVEAKGDVEPINWFFITITGLVAGVFYPPEIFLDHVPALYHLSRLFPQTYAIQGIRRILLNGMGFGSPEIIQIIMVLAIFAAVLFPLGHFAFQRGIKKAERMGKLTRWG